MSKTKARKPFALLLAGVGAAALMSSCGDNIVENFNGPVTPDATLNVTVLEFGNSRKIEGAVVTLLGANGQELESGVQSTSTVTFENVHVGNQKLLIEKEGYASMIVPTNLERDPAGAFGENVYIANDNSVRFHMLPLNSGLSGSLYYSRDGRSRPAEGATVRLELNSNINGIEIVGRIFTATVDENGAYSFSSLPPVGTAYKLTALRREFQEQTYEQIDLPDEDKVALTLGARSNVKAKFEYEKRVSSFLYLGDNALVINRDANVVLRFNEEIDVSKVTSFPISKAGNNQPMYISYEGGTITIRTVGDWNVGQFTITIDNDKLVSRRGNVFSTNVPTEIKVTVLADDLSSRKVENLRIDGTRATIPIRGTGSTRLDWNGVSGATGYNVYLREGNTYKFVNSSSSTNITVNFNEGDVYDRQYTFVIQPYNDRSTGTLEGDLNTLNVNSRPTANSISGGISKNVGDRLYDFDDAGFRNRVWNALRGTAAVNLGTYAIHFSEPMERGSISIDRSENWNEAPQTARIRFVEGNWVSDTEYRFQIEVRDATEPTSEEGARSVNNKIYRLTGLKSAKGRDFFVQYGDSGDDRVVRNSLDIRFRSVAP